MKSTFCLLLLPLLLIAWPRERLLRLAPLHEKRASHSATLLPDGRVLIAGGFRKGPDTYSQLYSNTAELYDPIRHTFTYTGNFQVARCGHTATLLANGKEVLITGGNNDHPRLASAELYDIPTGRWIRLPDMLAGREGHQAVLLNNGKVLIIGGTGDLRTSVELFNPATRKFEKSEPAPVDLNGTALPLADGRILIAGGNQDRQPTQFAITYDPKTNRFTRVGDMTVVRYKSSAALLPDGRALIIGGSNNRDWRGKYSSTELFDLRTNTFTRGPELNFERFKLAHSIITLKNGDILVTGGDRHIEQLHDGRFSVVATLDQPCYFSTATLLNGGDILLAGGYGNDAQCIDKTWIYTPQVTTMPLSSR
ncbi:MAG TPA: kelch repeat-containing protein [Puia sp.]|nr:kelch repeat-containing protein [Puia sp.]